jgi:hypothetical protein
MKTYTFEITVYEGNDEFWEGLEGSGCTEVTEMLEEALRDSGFNTSLDVKVRLTEFTDKD